MKWRILGLIGIFCFLAALIFSLRLNPAERNNTGNTLFEQQQYDLSLRAYQVAQVNAPDQPVAW